MASQITTQIGRRPRAARFTAAVTAIAALALMGAGAQSASAAAPQPGISCTTQSDCEELARRCPGSFVGVVARDDSGRPTLLGWCESKKWPRLACHDTADCKALKEICLKAAGTYTETVVGGEYPSVDGKCSLPKPPAPRAKEPVTIYCDGAEAGDCQFLSGYCVGVGGTYVPPGDTTYGICEYTPLTRPPGARR